MKLRIGAIEWKWPQFEVGLMVAICIIRLMPLAEIKMLAPHVQKTFNPKNNTRIQMTA